MAEKLKKMKNAVSDVTVLAEGAAKKVATDLEHAADLVARNIVKGIKRRKRKQAFLKARGFLVIATKAAAFAAASAAATLLIQRLAESRRVAARSKKAE